MKKNLTVIVAVLIMTVALAGCAGLNTGGDSTPGESPTMPAASESAGAPSPSAPPPTTEPTTPAESTRPAETGLVPLSNSTYEYKTQYIETTISLPLVMGIDAARGDEINAVFSDMMAALKESNTQMEAESKQMADDGYASPMPYMIDVGYNVPYNSGGLLCVVVYDYRYLGGAHGGLTQLTYLFDAETGRELTLDDLMKNGSGYREYLNDVIRREIDSRTESGELVELATFEDIGDKPWFYLTSHGLVFYFQQYEYFPYVAGIQEFTIPYGDLTEMLKTKYAGLEIKPVNLQPGENSLPAGGIVQAALEGNASTGFSWKYEIKGDAVLEYSDQEFVPSGADGAVGSGGTYLWNFRALSPGKATVIFTYSRDWEGGEPGAEEQTVQYTVTVK